MYVARVPSLRQLTIALNVGSRLPAHATSMRHVLLSGLSADALDTYFATATLTQLTPRTITDQAQLRAELDRVRRAGYSIASGERELGIQSVAAPIVDRSGTRAPSHRTFVTDVPYVTDVAGVSWKRPVWVVA